jgi:transposase
VAARREAWRRKQRRSAPRGFDPERLVFFDETGAKTDMTRRYGWGPRHERVAEPVPHGRWRTTTLLHAVDVTGTRAAMITDGPTNAAVFETFIDWLLAPKLRSGDVVVMDNLSSHKSARAVARIEGVGAKVLYLPPYSPDLNPIEKVFSKVKDFLRSAAARTERALYDAIAFALETVTARDCRNVFRSCGYRLRQM